MGHTAILPCDSAKHISPNSADSLHSAAPAPAQEEFAQAPFPLNNASWEQPAWGQGKDFGAALEARVCPWYDRQPVRSLCHIADRFDDHHCLTSEDCGIDAGPLLFQKVLCITFCENACHTFQGVQG